MIFPAAEPGPRSRAAQARLSGGWGSVVFRSGLAGRSLRARRRVERSSAPKRGRSRRAGVGARHGRGPSLMVMGRGLGGQRDQLGEPIGLFELRAFDVEALALMVRTVARCARGCSYPGDDAPGRLGIGDVRAGKEPPVQGAPGPRAAPPRRPRSPWPPPTRAGRARSCCGDGRDGCGRSAGRARRRASAGRPARAGVRTCRPATGRPAQKVDSVLRGRAFLSLPAAPGPAAPRGWSCIARVRSSTPFGNRHHSA